MPDPIGAEVAVANAQQPAVVHPATGEILDLTAPTDALAVALADAKTLGQQLQSYSRQIKDELLRRMDYERTYTAHLSGVTVEGDGERGPSYDGETLYDALTLLVPGVLSMAAVENAVGRDIAYTVKKRGVNALLKVTDERVLAAVRSAEIPDTKPRDVRVKIERGG